MLPFEKCKKILNSGNRKFNNEQIKQKIELIQDLAEISVELYFKQKKDEKCSNNVKSK